MNTKKFAVRKLGLMALLACTVSACMDEQGMESVDYSSPSRVSDSAAQPVQATQASASSTVATQPAQKSTPGPKREAAPQLPSIDNYE